MFGLGMSEIIFLGILALIVIGPKELPELARTIGRFMNELKRSTNVLSDELKQQARIDLYDQQPKKNDPSMATQTQQSEAAKGPHEPEQMELTNQQDNSKSPEGTKPS